MKSVVITPTPAETPDPLWRQVSERGALVGMLFTAWVYRHCGRRFAEFILWFVVTYFFITSRSGRKASRDFMRRIEDMWREHPARKPGQGAHAPSLRGCSGSIRVHRHFMDFALTALDRFDVWTGTAKPFHYTFKGREHLNRLVAAKQGAVLFGAHFGNSDVLRGLLDPSTAKVHFLTDQRGSQKFFSVLKKYCPKMMEGIQEYDSQRPENVLALKAGVERGEFVGLLADRNVSESRRGARRVVRVPFLGSTAAFPQSPFLFAALLGCPVLFIAGARRGRGEYELIVEPIADRIVLPPEAGPDRDRCLEKYAAAFAEKLESYCLHYPTQWFNFYDFWRA